MFTFSNLRKLGLRAVAALTALQVFLVGVLVAMAELRKRRQGPREGFPLVDQPEVELESGESRLKVYSYGVPLYEAMLEGLVLFLVMWWYTAQPRPRLAPSGLFLVCYGVFRFAVEFVRVPDENRGYLAFGWLTTGQLLSLPMLVGGVWMLVVAYRRNEPSGNYTRFS